MKVLLVAVNAKYIHSNLAVYSLRAYAKQYAENIGLAEFTINHTEEDILSNIYEEKADVAAFSCYIWNIGMISRIIKELKKVQPQIKIWLGGPEVSYDAMERLKAQKELDGIMIGEGEQTFLELMEYYVLGKGELSDINGLAFRSRNEDIIITPSQKPLCLDTIPFPYENLDKFKNKIIYYESSRGCPFSCSYCLSSIDKRVRLRSTELVKKELTYFLDYGVAQVKFVDRTFNCNKKHAMEIWRFLKENDNGITNFHFEISADLLDDEEMELLAGLRPGQIQFEIGVQSTNQDTVEAIHRRMDFNRLSSNVERIHKGANIHQHLDLIAGLPLEGFASFEKSFDDVYCLKPDQLQLGFLKVLKGSLMDEDCKNYGIVFRETPPYEVLFTKYLTYDEILKIKGICEMVEVYYNSGQFGHAIRFLEHFYPSPVKLYEALDEFYRDRQLYFASHNRFRRYEILLDFYMESLSGSNTLQEYEGLFEEILILDLCLREELKNRPSYAPELPKIRDAREIYKKYGLDHKSAHMELFHYDAAASANSGMAVEKEQLLLFDYSSRDPLNKEAKVIEIRQAPE